MDKWQCLYRPKESIGHNSGLAKVAVTSLIEGSFFYSASVLADSLVLLNPLLRQAPNPWQLYHTQENKLFRPYLLQIGHCLGSCPRAGQYFLPK